MNNKVKKIVAGIIASVAATGGVLTYPIQPDITVQEYQALVQMYDYEIKQQGKIVLENVKDADVQVELHRKIRERVPSVEEGESYNEAREILLKKVEKTNFLKKMTNK